MFIYIVYLGVCLMKKQKINDKSILTLNLISSLSDSYTTIYYIVPETGEYKLITNDIDFEKKVVSRMINGNDFYNDTICNVEKVIAPDDREKVLDFFNKDTLIKVMEEKDFALIDYRLIINDVPVWYRAKTVKIYDENNNLRYVVGVMNLAEEKEREYSFIQNQVVADYFLSTFEFAFYVNLNHDTFRNILHNNITLDKFVKGSSYTECARKYILRCVAPEDIDKVGFITDLEAIRECVLGNEEKTVIFSVIEKGLKRFFKLIVLRGGDYNHAAIAIQNVDDETKQSLRNEERLRRNLEIINILASEYSSVYYVDLNNDNIIPYAMNIETESTWGSVFSSGITYSEAYKIYVDKTVFPEDKDIMFTAGSVDNIMKELSNKKTFITTYRNSSEHYCEMKFVKVGSEEDEPVAFALGFANKDNELRAKEEEERILQRNIDIIDILASEYTSVYYIDLTTDELDPYTMNEKTENQLGNIFRNAVKYSDAYRLYVDTLVYPEDKIMMLRAGSTYSILKELTNKKTYVKRYRDYQGHYCEMKFVKVGDDDNPRAVALGFADRDAEIRLELERKAIQARDAAVISGLSDDFGCVIYVNYDTAQEIHYRFDPLFEKNIPGWASINSFDKRLEMLVNTIMHPDDRERFSKLTLPEVVKKAVETENVYYVNFRTIIDGETTYYQAKFVRDEHSDNHVIAGFHNVDEETKREMEALRKAESANRAKTDFLFNMSHDIRTPMNAIIGFTNMAIKEINNPEKALENLKKVYTSSDMLLALINDILDMSRIESGKATLHEEKNNILKLFENIEPVMSNLAEAGNIKLTFETEDLTDEFIFSDYSRVERILVNIISNAIKYTNPGGFVRVNLKQLPDTRAGYALYRFTVEDNGIGMSKEFQNRMFDEFSREESTTNSGIQGTGLGLSLARKLTYLMDGTIECDSEQGRGSTFTVTIPFRIQSSDEIQHLKINDIDVEDFSFNGKRVLLVEDNDLNREIALDILEEEGMQVDEAINGQEAVDEMRNHDEDYYDLVLMDIQMPVMDGYTATKAIRKMYPNMRTPIIALSANAFEEDRQKSLASGMVDHVAKPININILKKSMAKFI